MKKKDVIKKINFSKLRGRMAEKGISQKELAQKLNLTEQWLSAKLNGKAIFDLCEMKILIDELEIKDEEIRIFFLT